MRLSAAESSETVSSGRLRRGSFIAAIKPWGGWQLMVRIASAGQEPWTRPAAVLHRGSRMLQGPRQGIPTDEHFAPRLRRARTCAGLEDGGKPAQRPADLRAGQCRHRARGRMRRARPRRPCGRDRRFAARTASISSSSDRRRRCAPGSSTISRPPASRRSGRAAPPPGSRAPRLSPRICAARTAYRPPPTNVSARPNRLRPMSASAARRS